MPPRSSSFATITAMDAKGAAAGKEGRQRQQSFLSRLSDSFHLDEEVSCCGSPRCREVGGGGGKDDRGGGGRCEGGNGDHNGNSRGRRGSMLSSISRKRASLVPQRRSKSVVVVGSGGVNSANGGGGNLRGPRRSSIVEVDSEDDDSKNESNNEFDEVSLGDLCRGRSWDKDEEEEQESAFAFALDDYNESFRDDDRFKEVDGMMVLASMMTNDSISGTNDSGCHDDPSSATTNKGRRSSGAQLLQRSLRGMASECGDDESNKGRRRSSALLVQRSLPKMGSECASSTSKAKVKPRRHSFQDVMGGLMREL